MTNLKQVDKKAQLSKMNALQIEAMSGLSQKQATLQSFYACIEEIPNETYEFVLLSSGTYFRILSDLSTQEIQESLEYMIQRHPKIVCEYSSSLTDLINQHPEILDWTLDKLCARLQHKQGKSYAEDIMYTIVYIACVFDTTKVEQTLENLLDNHGLIGTVAFFNHSSDLYERFPRLHNKIFQKLVDYYAPDRQCGFDNLFAELFKMNVAITSEDSEPTVKHLPPAVLDVIENNITNPCVEEFALDSMTYILGNFLKYATPEYVTRAKQILNKIRQTHNDKIRVLRAVARQLGETDILRSFAFFGKRVPKTADNEHGWTPVLTIPRDETCVLYFGGGGLNTARLANGSLKKIETLFTSAGMNDINLYAVVQDFGYPEHDRLYAFNRSVARKKQMQKYHRNVRVVEEVHAEDEDPKYVQQIFNCIFLPRLTDSYGKRLECDVACKNIRKITTVTHCHGGYTFLRLEELMQQKMVKLGYTAAERATIQKQLVCVAHAPFCPLGVSKSTMVSFSSNQDGVVKHFNNFSTTIREMVLQDIAYFPNKRGNVFIGSGLNKSGYDLDEHDFKGYDEFTANFTQTGKKLSVLEGRTILNSIHGALNGQSIDSVRDLVANGDKDTEQIFDRATEYGNQIWRDIVHTLIHENMALKR